MSKTFLQVRTGSEKSSSVTPDAWEWAKLQTIVTAILAGQDFRPMEDAFFKSKDPCVKDLDELENLTIVTAEGRAQKIVQRAYQRWNQKHNSNSRQQPQETGKNGTHTNGSAAA